MATAQFSGHVSRIQSNRFAPLSDKVRIILEYSYAGVSGSLEADFPIADAKDFYVGQELTITITTAKRERQRGAAGGEGATT